LPADARAFVAAHPSREVLIERTMKAIDILKTAGRP
jgi:hypothetical protein